MAIVGNMQYRLMNLMNNGFALFFGTIYKHCAMIVISFVWKWDYFCSSDAHIQNDISPNRSDFCRYEQFVYST